MNDVRIALSIGIHRASLSDLRRLDPAEFEQLHGAAEEFLANGNVAELRALQAEAAEFQDPLPGFSVHPDHTQVRAALRAAALRFNAGHQGVRFGLEIDIDETFGFAASVADDPRPTCIQIVYINGVPYIEYNYGLQTFQAGEPAVAEYLIGDVLDGVFGQAQLVGKGLREHELDVRLVLTYRHTGPAGIPGPI